MIVGTRTRNFLEKAISDMSQEEVCNAVTDFNKGLVKTMKSNFESFVKERPTRPKLGKSCQMIVETGSQESCTRPDN